ncbi:RNA pyrophosphohydrolase [Anaplasmataceae bacterium AB001_6]|nr:RNA pyrophosphohydrolase [Anaplasmataceae bacterium AB001_6]
MGIYRKNVGIVLFNKDNYVFVGQRIDHKNIWQMPQGGVESGETLEEAAFREISEEVGLERDKVQLIACSDRSFRYEIPKDSISRKKFIDRDKYIGQEQNWLLFKFLGRDEDINIMREPREFRAWCWVHHLKVNDISTAFKRVVYEEVLQEFSVYL